MRTCTGTWGLWAVAALLMAACVVPAATAQTATVNGFVNDAATGQGLELVNVVLANESGVVRGVVTNRDGLFLIPRIEPGRYELRATFVGYEPHTDTLDLEPGQVVTRNIVLQPDQEALDEVVVQTERTDGAARVTAGRQTVRPADIELVPTPGVTGDLASYLTTLPGVVATGDRGGQLFIRGGEPSQNLVLLDGMTLYQPFHILGFYSAFPAEILNRTDIYAGGFGSKFGGRISSVIDVWARNGNNRTYAGSASISPFIATAQIEGPLWHNRASLIASVRQSLVEQSAERIIDEPLPYDFGDAFAKLHVAATPNSRLSLSGIYTHDRGTIAEDTGGQLPEEMRWKNSAFSIRYLLLPSFLPILAETRVSYSRLKSELGPPEEPTRTSSVANTQVVLDASFLGDRVDVDAGFSIQLITLRSELGGLYQNVELRDSKLDEVALYIEPEFTLGAGLHLRPGLRMQFYQVRFDPYLEPRLRLVWERGRHQVSGALGLYHQELVGLSDRRDAASVFTVWTNIPRFDPRADDVRGGRIARALHAILGYRVSPAPWLDFAVEGYYKKINNVFIAEWTAFPRLTTRLQPASGSSVGFDTRLEVRRGPFTFQANYGLSSTRYEAEQASLPIWYGVESLRFRPPHDRRHQVNALAALSLFGFDLSARWEFGSGLPFSRALGFDGFVLIDDVFNVAEEPSFRRVIYERPYNAELPSYHRLDVALERTFRLGRARLTLQGSIINVYDRANLFYLDVFTLRRVDQLPFTPSLGLRMAFE